MELLEMELIKKLQNTQAIQKEAYAELEEALQSKPNLSFNMQQHQPMNMSKGGGQWFEKVNFCLN